MTTNPLFNASSAPRPNSTSRGSAYTSLLSSCAAPYDAYTSAAWSAYEHSAPFVHNYTRAPACSSILQSFCEIWVDGVDLLYWPTPYATYTGLRATGGGPLHAIPSPSTFVSDNFTFSAQSAYLIYKNAKAVLQYNTESSLTGPFYSSLTVPYPSNSLSSYQDCNQAPSGGSWPLRSINYQDFNSPPRWSVVSQQRPCHLWSIIGDSLQAETFPPSQIATQYTSYQNQPIVALPAPLTNVNLAWATCIMGDTGLGLYDPPRAIFPVSSLTGPQGLATQTVAGEESALPQKIAQPAAGVTSNQPTKTSVVVQLPDGNTIVDYPPLGASIQAPSQTAGSSPAQGVSIVDAPTSPNPIAVGSPMTSGSSNAGNQGIGKAIAAGFNDPVDEDSAPIVTVDVAPSADPNAPANVQVVPENDPASNTQPGTDEISAVSLPAVAVGDHQLQAAPDGGVVVNGVSVNAATPVNSAYGVQVSSGGSGVVIGGNTVAVSPAAAGGTAASISLNGHTVQVFAGGSGSQIAVDGQTIPAGTSQAQVGGNMVSVLNNGHLSILPTTLPYVPISKASTAARVSVNGEQVSPQFLPDGAVAVAGTTLVAGGPDATISGVHMSALPNNAGLIIGQSTIPPTSISPPRLGLVIGGKTLTPIDNNAVIADGSTISKSGQSFTLNDGEIASLENGAVVAGTQTVPLPTAALDTSYDTNGIVIDGETFRPVGSTGVAVDGTTLSKPGQSVTLLNGETARITDGALIVSTQTLPIVSLAKATGDSAEAAVTEGQIETPSNGNIVYNGVTLSNGGPAITLSDGEVISLENSMFASSPSSLNVDDAVLQTSTTGAAPPSPISTGKRKNSANRISVRWESGCMLLALLLGAMINDW